MNREEKIAEEWPWPWTTNNNIVITHNSLTMKINTDWALEIFCDLSKGFHHKKCNDFISVTLTSFCRCGAKFPYISKEDINKYEFMAKLVLSL